MAGRPTKYTEELANDICRRIMSPESLRSVCRDEAMPARSTVHKWLAENDSFSDRYARACSIRADEIHDEMFEIADDGSNDWMEIIGKDGESLGWKVNGEAVQRSKLRVDTRKWSLARMNPSKYGDKAALELTGKDGGPIEVTDARARLDDLVSRHAAAGGTPESSS